MERLYSSKDPQDVYAQQKELQMIQKSPQGYEVASYLLEHESRNCKYFGALTYAVVIQNSQLNEERLFALISSIQGHISRLLADSTLLSSNLFILRKLMSDLSLLYIRSSVFNPVWALLRALGGPEGSTVQDFSKCVSQLPPAQLGLLLVFFSILVEDVLKLNDYVSAINSSVKTEVFPYLEMTIEYLAYLQESKQLSDEMDVQALDTLNSWMSYIPNTNGDAKYDSGQLTLIVKFLYQHFDQPLNVENTERMSALKHCLLIFNEILEVNATLLSLEQKLSLYSILFNSGQWGERFMADVVFTQMRSEFEEEVNAFVDLVLTVLQLNSIRLSKTILESTTQNILSIALKLTSIEGTALSDESISERMLVFWEELASVYQDSDDLFEILFRESNEPEFQSRFEFEKKSIFNEVAKVYWRKIHIPEFSIYKTLRGDFNGYRNTVAEFFLGAYALLKADFYEMMCESLISSIRQYPENQGLIVDIEATLYLLFKINEDTVYFESQERMITPFSLRIFGSNLMEVFKSISFSDERGQYFYSTFVQYLASNEFYLKTPEGSTYLGQVFDMLFPIIMASNSTLSLLASKTATKICEECNLSLTGFLPNLEVIVIEMLRNPAIDSLIRLRMFNAYSVVAKGIKDLGKNAQIIKGMVSAINEATQAMIKEAGSTLSEAQEDYLVSLISCLENIGKGSSLTDEEIDGMLPQEEVEYREFWREDTLKVKPEILAIVRELSLEYQPLSQNALVIDKCVLVIKVGFRERFGGPFDFDQQFIVQYLVLLMDQLSNANAVPYVFALFECMISLNFNKMSDSLVSEMIERLFVIRLEFLRTDPDMIKSAIDLFSRIIEFKPSLIIHSAVFSNTIIRFALDGFNANESFIIKSILKFWINTISMKRGTKDDQEALNRLFVDQQLGKLVTYDLMSSFLKATRSYLEYYYNVFRSLVGKFPVQFKQWLIQSLEEMKPTLLVKVDPKEVNMFAHKLLVTRGRRTANDVLKSFWLTVNGLVEYNSQSY